MNEKLISFVYSLERSSKTITLVLSGAVVSGKFATPKRPSVTIGGWEYDGLMVLKSVTVYTGGSVVELPALTLPLNDKILAWSEGKPKLRASAPLADE